MITFHTGETIEEAELVNAIDKIQARWLDLQETSDYEDEEEEWTIYQAYGGINDRQFEIVVAGKTVVEALKALAKHS